MKTTKTISLLMLICSTAMAGIYPVTDDVFDTPQTISAPYQVPMGETDDIGFGYLNMQTLLPLHISGFTNSVSGIATSAAEAARQSATNTAATMAEAARSAATNSAAGMAEAARSASTNTAAAMAEAARTTSTNQSAAVSASIANAAISSATPSILATAAADAAQMFASAATGVRQTNWVLGTFYTNATSRSIQVSSVVTNLLTVLGTAGVELRVGVTNSATTYVADVQASRPILGLVVGIGVNGSVRGTVPPGGRFQIADISTGANTATLGNNTGQYILLP